MTTQSSRPYFPKFSKEVLEHFSNELMAAGSLDNFMESKQAIRKTKYAFSILPEKDIGQYEEAFLTGLYRSTRPVFRKIPLPYDFWLQLYWALIHYQAKNDWWEEDEPSC